MNSPDFLFRQPYFNLLKSIITNQKDNLSGYSFSIDGEWGCGKTWILTELENHLEEDSDNKYLIFHYNAWENDFYDEPLVALLSVMIESLKKYNQNRFCKQINFIIYYNFNENGKIDSRLEVLNGIETNYKPYIRPNNIGQELIKLDDLFLATFISSLMNGIEKRLQEKIFKQVALCHKLTIQTGIQYNSEQMSYAILIYEIISCICRYVYHSKKTCKVTTHDDVYTLDFYTGIDTSVVPETTEYTKFQNNIYEFLTYPINYFEDNEGRHRYAFEIHDTKSYLLAFFTEQEVQSYAPLQNGL